MPPELFTVLGGIASALITSAFTAAAAQRKAQSSLVSAVSQAEERVRQSMEKEIAILRAELRGAQKELATLQREVASLGADKQVLLADRERLQGLVDELTHELQEKKDALDAKTAEVERMAHSCFSGNCPFRPGGM